MSAISKTCLSKKVCSVNNIHLANGLFAIFMVLLIEAMSLFEMLTTDIQIAIAATITMQTMVVYFVAYAIKYLTPYMRKTEFELFFSRLDNITDAASLQKYYYIVNVDSYGVLFTDKDDQRAADDWAMICKGTPTRSIENCMSIDFKQCE